MTAGKLCIVALALLVPTAALADPTPAAPAPPSAPAPIAPPSTGAPAAPAPIVAPEPAPVSRSQPAASASKPTTFDLIDRGDAVEVIAHNIKAARTAVLPLRARLQVAVTGSPTAKRTLPGDATVKLIEFDSEGSMRVLSIKLNFEYAEVKALSRFAQAIQVGDDLHVLIPRKLPGEGAAARLPEPTLPPALAAAVARIDHAVQTLGPSDPNALRRFGTSDGKPAAATGGPSKATPDGKPEARPDGKADAKAEPKTGAKADGKADAKLEPKTSAKADGKADARPDNKIDAKATTKTDGSSDAKPSAKPDAKIDGKSLAKTDGSSEAKPDAKIDARSLAKTDGSSDAKASAKLDGKSEPAPAAATIDKQPDAKLAAVTAGPLPSGEPASPDARTAKPARDGKPLNQLSADSDEIWAKISTYGAIGLAAAGIGLWLMRRRRALLAPHASIEVIAQRSLGGRARVVWLSAGPREMIVSVTAQQVRVLGQWRKTEVQPAAHAPHPHIDPRIEPQAFDDQTGVAAPAPGGLARGTADFPAPLHKPVSPAVTGILRLRARTGQMPIVSEEVATGDVVADEQWAKEILAATTGPRR